MSKSLWNPKAIRHDKNGKAEPLTLPADTQFVGHYIQQSERDAANDRLNKMIDDHHRKIGNLPAVSVADESDDTESD